MSTLRAPYLVALALVTLFVVTGVRHLDTAPQVYEDEPWQASTAYKLLTSGVFGSDLFAGFYNMNQRYYGFMPLHPLLLAGFFRAFGVGLAQARLETVTLSALTLVLTFALGARLFSAWVGAVAVGLLVLVRWTGLTYVQLTGIPLVDLARIARYDPLVPVLGLAALHVYLSARSRNSGKLHLAGGLLAGLAGLAHVYGLFWVPVLLILTIWDGQRRHAAWLISGVVLPWLPYAAYVLTDVPDWRGQTAIYASRFELLNLGWYLNNLAQEYHRYGPGLGSLGVGWLARPGFWLLLAALPLSLIVLARRSSGVCGAAARAILVPCLVFPALFALFITLKLVNYTLIELPLFALAIAFGLCTVWSRVRFRPVLGVLGAAVIVESGFAFGRLEQAAATITPYPAFISAIRPYLPSDARILGLHSYWLGLQDFDYRSFLVPLNWADEGLPLDQGLARVAPDVVLLDARMRDYFASSPDGSRFEDWMTRHSAELIGRIEDPRYGVMEIYRTTR